MFGNIGWTEMIIIAGIALVVMGPEKFPDFAKMALRTFRDLRGYLDDLKAEAAKELRPVQQEFNTLSRVDPEKYIDALTRDDETEVPSAGSAGFTDRYAASSSSSSSEETYGHPADEGGSPEPSSEYREAMPGEEHAQGYPDASPEADSASESQSPSDDPLNVSPPERLDG